LKFYLEIDKVGTAMKYGLDGRDSIPGRGKRFFFSPQRADLLWNQFSLLPMGIGGSFPWGEAADA
jgi:hypothetical protein